MNDEQRLLASAAIDGDVTSAERARAESDPDVVAEIERLQVVRQAIRVDPAPDPTRREDAIAAALAVFDRAGTVTVTAPPPPSAAARRRHRWMAPLAAAAAVIAIAVGGVVAFRGDGSGDDDDAASSATQVERAASQLNVTDEASPAATAGGSAAADDAGGDAETAAEGTAADGTQLGAAAPSAAPPTLSSPEDITDFVRSIADVDATAVAACTGGTLVGTATYVIDGDEVPVEVLRVADAGQAVAVRVDTCEVVARAPLP